MTPPRVPEPDAPALPPETPAQLAERFAELLGRRDRAAVWIMTIAIQERDKRLAGRKATAAAVGAAASSAAGPTPRGPAAGRDHLFPWELSPDWLRRFVAGCGVGALIAVCVYLVAIWFAGGGALAWAGLAWIVDRWGVPALLLPGATWTVYCGVLALEREPKAKP
jgi:hypothetical protein